MRKITATILVALLTFSVGFGTVAAKPKDDKPGNGKDNGALVLKIRENGVTDPVGEWSCSGVFVQNRNHARVNLDCTVQYVGPYTGTYTSGVDPVPDWIMAYEDEYSARALELLAFAGVSEEDVTWQIVVTPNDDGTGTIQAVAEFK